VSNEAVVQQQVQLAMARLGAQVWRNNSGACTDDTGRLIRYGLGNSSAALNAAIKLGRPHRDHTHDCPSAPRWSNGRCLYRARGQTARLGTVTPGDKRGQAQKRFLDIVVGVGGMAGFVTDPADLANILVL